MHSPSVTPAPGSDAEIHAIGEDLTPGHLWGIPTRRSTWVALFALAFLGHFLVAEPGMFPGWDESVFFSQSGDIVGVDSNPSYFAPSREPGTPLLIWGLRGMGLNLEAIRIGFMLIFLISTALGFYLLAPVLGWGSVAGFIAMTGHWISLAFSWRFFGVPIAAALLVLSIGIGVKLLNEPNYRRRWMWAVALAASSAGMLMMRHLEGWLAAGVLWLLLLLFALRRRSRLIHLVLVGVLISLVLFSTAEFWRATYYHGSVGEWLEALRGQLDQGIANPEPTMVRFLKTSGSLAAGYHLWFQERIPTISVQLSAAAISIVFALVVWRMFSTRDDHHRVVVGDKEALTMMWWLASSLMLLYFLFFTLGGFPSSPRDRYMMWLVAAGALLLGILLRGSFRLAQTLLLGVAVIVWIIGSVGAARFDTMRFLESGEGLRQLGLTMHLLSDGEECVAASRYGAPALQLASGCQVRTITDANLARAWLEEAASNSVRYLAYPPAAELETVPGWTSVSVEETSLDLWLRDEP